MTLRLDELRALAISSDASLAAEPGEGPGDALTRQIAYARHVARYDIVVRTTPGSRSTVRRPAPALTVRAVPATRWDFVARGYAAALAVAWRARSQVATCQDPISMGLVGYLLKRRLGVGLNLQINGDIIDNPYWLAESRLYPAFNVLARWLIRRADTLRVSTASERAKYVEQWGMPEERVWNVPFMVDFSRFLGASAAGVRERLEVPDDVPLVLFLGRLVKAKDLGVLLRAAPSVLAHHPRTVFVLAGAGPEEPRLRQLARDLRLERQVRFPGRVPYHRVPSLYAAADVFVLTSHYEGTSMVTLEAAASGLPVVATDVTGARDAILDGESGLLVPKRDPAALATALSCVLDDPRWGRAMGARGREYVLSRFDPSRIARAMADMWLATARLAR